MNIPHNRIIPYIWETPAWPRFSWREADLAAALQAVAANAGELRGLRRGLSDIDQLQTLAEEIGQEAAASFAIEGEVVDAASISASVAASLAHRERWSAAGGQEAIAEMLLDAQTNAEPLEAARLHRWHRLMFEGSRRLKQVGAWRKTEMQIVSGPLGHETIEFEAPPPERVAAEMARLLDWLAASDAPAAIRAAVGHLWFETIHPYEDGNGRIGRAMAEQILAADPLFAGAPFSLSRAILAERKGYYAALGRMQRLEPSDVDAEAIDATAFIAWFLKTIEAGLDQAREAALFLAMRNRFFARWEGALTDRQTQTLRRLFAEGAERVDQGISTKPYARIANVSKVTAARDLADLLEKGAIRKGDAGGRSTRYWLTL